MFKKNYILSKSILIFVIAICFVSCEKFIGGDLNSDPNKPKVLPISAQMPAIQLSLVDVYGGQFSRFNCMLTQHVEGVARQCSSNNQYSGLKPFVFNSVWEIIYEKVLNELQIAKSTAFSSGLNHYLGILKIMEAYTLMISTDVWDDMPYKEAFQGIDFLNPKYDSQVEIYGNIYKFLEDGITLLEGVTGSIAPGIDDIFNEGDISKWIKAAHAIKARGYLHQKNYQGAMNEALASFESADDNLNYQYPNANSGANWYRFNRDRTGDIEFHPVMRTIMKELDDTLRMEMLDVTFNEDHPYLVANFNEDLISYRETQFIIAEANFRLNAGGTSVGYDAMLNGIRASFFKFGLSEVEYLSFINSGIIPSVDNLTLEDIMIQKHIAMFLQPESYSDYRRTGLPTLLPVSGSNIPVRWNYSANEYQFNSSAPSASSVDIYLDKVDWNQ